MTTTPETAEVMREDQFEMVVEIVANSVSGEFDATALRNLSVERSRLCYECRSGDRVQATWRGIPFDGLLPVLDPPGETTHVVIVGADGRRACLPVRTVLDGMLAVERDGDPLDGPRFVAPEVAGPRAIKDVEGLDTLALPADVDRTDHESLLDTAGTNRERHPRSSLAPIGG